MQPQDFGFEYQQKISSRARSLRVHIDRFGQVIVTTPKRYPQSLLHEFLTQSSGWIEKHVALHRRRSRVDGDGVGALLYFGVPYRIEIQLHAHGPTIEQKDSFIIVRPISPTPVSCALAVERWLKAEADRYMSKRIYELANEMNVSFSSLHMRDQSTRWGSCSASKRLQLNWRLIQAPKEVIDYVMIHELAHLVHMNHSERFWAYVERFDPAFLIHKKWLRFHGAALHKDFRNYPAFRSFK